METDFILFEEAVLILKLGFSESCIKAFCSNGDSIFCCDEWNFPRLKSPLQIHEDSGGECFSQPSYAQAFRFFRNEKKLCFFVNPQNNSYVIEGIFSSKSYSSFHEAELKLLQHLIHIYSFQ